VNASDVMTRTVVSVTRETSLEEAARLMVQNRISGLPVLSGDGAVLGMITEGDLLRRVETNTVRHSGWLASFLLPGHVARHYVRSHARKVGEMVGTEVISVSPDTPLAEVVAIMESRRVKRVPVLENGHLVGIVARSDLVKALLKSLPRDEQVPSVTDGQIRERILAEVDKQSWAPRVGVDCAVRNGEIELRGIISDENMRTALCVIAENTPGARGVRDRMICVEPLSGELISAGPDDRPSMPL
jgi:CBS domain-containing protein